jgi:hypothetical protein
MSTDTEFENSSESQGADASTSETLTVEELQEKNRQLYARLKKAEDEAKAAKEARGVQAGDSQVNIPSVEVERLTLKVDGYNDSEIAEIMSLGGLKALSNPLVKRAVEAMREERRVENAQVNTDGAMSDFSRKYSEADLRKMSAEELEKILPKA